MERSDRGGYRLRSKIDNEYRHALLVDSRELLNIEGSVTRNFGKPRVTASCQDGTTLVPDDVRSLLDFDNLAFRRIKEVQISAGDPRTDRIIIELGASTRTARVSIDSDDDSKNVATAAELRNLIYEMKPWYSVLSRLNLIYILLGPWLIAGISISIAKLLGVLNVGEVQGLNTFDILNIGLLVVGVVCALGYVGNTLLHVLFPRVFFLIGKQKQVYTRLVAWRKALFVTFCLGMIASIIANLAASCF